MANTTFEGTAREVLRVQFNSRTHLIADLAFNPTAERGSREWRGVPYLGKSFRHCKASMSSAISQRGGAGMWITTRCSPPTMGSLNTMAALHEMQVSMGRSETTHRMPAPRPIRRCSQSRKRDTASEAERIQIFQGERPYRGIAEPMRNSRRQRRRALHRHENRRDDPRSRWVSTLEGTGQGQSGDSWGTLPGQSPHRPRRSRAKPSGQCRRRRQRDDHRLEELSSIHRCRAPVKGALLDALFGSG